MKVIKHIWNKWLAILNFFEIHPSIFLNVPAVFYLAYLYYLPEETHRVLTHTGYIAFALLIFILSLHSLCIVFKKTHFFKLANHYSRVLYVMVFTYSTVHAWAFLVQKHDTFGFWTYFFHPLYIPAFIAWFCFFLFAITSNRFSVRTLGTHNWILVHKLVYAGELFVFLHLMLQRDATALWAVLGFVFILIFQYLRKISRYNVFEEGHH